MLRGIAGDRQKKRHSASASTETNFSYSFNSNDEIDMDRWRRWIFKTYTTFTLAFVHTAMVLLVPHGLGFTA